MRIIGAAVSEGTEVSTAAGTIGIPVKLAHPNAAKLFINWILTKEGQTVFSKGYGSASLSRPTQAINPLLLPQPGEKLFLQSEEALLSKDKLKDVARQVIK